MYLHLAPLIAQTNKDLVHLNPHNLGLNVTLTSVVVYASTFSVLAPLILGFYSRNWPNRVSRLLILLCVASIISDIISLILTSKRINNWPVGNLYLLVQFVILFKVVNDGTNKLFNAAFVICLCFSSFDFLVLETPTVFNSFSAYANGILMIILSLSFLRTVMIEMPVERVQSLPMFWVSFGVLLYYGGNVFLFLFNNYLIEHLPYNYKVVWMLHNTLNIFKNLFLFLGLWSNFRNRISQQ